MARTIIVNIGTDGATTVETKGFTGTECLKETAALEKALGKVETVTATSEMHRRAEQVVRR